MRKYSSLLATFVAPVLAMIASPLIASAEGFKVLHAFEGDADGGGLYARLTLDDKRDLYGVTSGGGAQGYGTVFELMPRGGGKWTKSILYSFCPDPPACSDGDLPSNGLTLDQSGNLYGNTRYTIFKLSPSPTDWELTVILAQGTNADLIADGKGNLIGEIGAGRCNPPGGEIMKLKPPPDGGDWIPVDLYDFCVHNNKWNKGNGPAFGLSWDAAGNLYGVTETGGKDNFGVVFQLEHSPSGWKEHVLHNFGGAPDGFFVQGGVALDNQGRVYGATEQGGTGCGGGVGCGVIYQLTKQLDGHWKENILHDFPNIKNGASPTGTLAIDAEGSLYGVASGGGGPCGKWGCGVVYKMVHNPDDSFTYKVLHRFQGTDGFAPLAGVILDAKGNIYGTTSAGGQGGYGVVFKITQ